jgi:hypothetical protein
MGSKAAIGKSSQRVQRTIERSAFDSTAHDLPMFNKEGALLKQA